MLYKPGIAAISNDSFTSSATFGTYQYHAICTPGTINSCRRCVFQYLHRGYIILVKIIKTAIEWNTINNYQGIIGGAN